MVDAAGRHSRRLESRSHRDNTPSGAEGREEGARIHGGDLRGRGAGGQAAARGHVGCAWRHLDPADRREVVRLLASGLALARDEKPAPAWRDVADLL